MYPPKTTLQKLPFDVILTVHWDTWRGTQEERNFLYNRSLCANFYDNLNVSHKHISYDDPERGTIIVCRDDKEDK